MSDDKPEYHAAVRRVSCDNSRLFAVQLMQPDRFYPEREAVAQLFLSQKWRDEYPDEAKVTVDGVVVTDVVELFRLIVTDRRECSARMWLSAHTYGVCLRAEFTHADEPKQ